jgi:hypothetical protein
LVSLKLYRHWINSRFNIIKFNKSSLYQKILPSYLIAHVIKIYHYWHSTAKLFAFLFIVIESILVSILSNITQDFTDFDKSLSMHKFPAVIVFSIQQTLVCTNKNNENWFPDFFSRTIFLIGIESILAMSLISHYQCITFLLS